MDAKSYVGDIIGGSLFVAESRTIADILLSEPSEEDFRHLIEEENVLQKRSGHTAVRYASTIRTRMEPMGLFYLELVRVSNKDVELGFQIDQGLRDFRFEKNQYVFI